MTPTDPRHGRPSGYDAGCRESCCRRAAAEYEYRRRIDGILGRRYTVPSLGTARRIQALVALGWTFGQLSERLGRCHDYARKLAFQSDTYVRATTAQRVADLYEQLSMTLPPTTTGRERWRANYARTTAARNGWVPPLCWDDPDTDERPHGVRTDDARDLLAEWADLRAAGESIEHAAKRLGVTVGAIERAEFRAKERVA